jgi:hypothetical protein
MEYVAIVFFEMSTGKQGASEDTASRNEWTGEYPSHKGEEHKRSK